MNVVIHGQRTTRVLLIAAAFSALSAGYEVKDFHIKPAAQYTAHLDFQNIVIAAYPCETEGKTLEIFDTKKLHEKGFLPVLLVIENGNEFPIRIHEADIYLVQNSGSRQGTVPYVDVLLEINSKNPISYKSGQKQLLLNKVVKKEMRLDFEHKSFGEKLIGPFSEDHGVVFFRLPQGGNLKGSRLYFPEVVNVTTDEPLVFFEFDLVTTG
jgi:hypothetical protein